MRSFAEVRSGRRGGVPRGLAFALAACGLVAALIAVGRATRERLRDAERFAVPFSETECRPEPPVPRGEFLAEVQYLAGLPDRLSLLDGQLARRLADAFARHPWVKRVRGVEVTAARRVRASLEYRVPVLAVPFDGDVRAVDRDGVLLPVKAATDGLPVFRGHAGPPAGPAGTRWGDPAVERAAAAAAGNQ